MKKMVKKTTTWLLIFCMVIGFVPAFGSAAAAEEKAVQILSDSAVLPSEGEAEGSGSVSLMGLLWEWLKSIGLNLKTVSVEELLKLPANVMDDVLTYIFAIFKILGVNIDALYEKLSAIF